jgi:hypothetical protein
MGVIAQLAKEMEELGQTEKFDAATIMRMQTVLTTGSFMLLRLEEQYEELHQLIKNPPIIYNGGMPDNPIIVPTPR